MLNAAESEGACRGPVSQTEEQPGDQSPGPGLRKPLCLGH